MRVIFRQRRAAREMPVRTTLQRIIHQAFYSTSLPTMVFFLLCYRRQAFCADIARRSAEDAQHISTRHAGKRTHVATTAPDAQAMMRFAFRVYDVIARLSSDEQEAQRPSASAATTQRQMRAAR